MKTIITIIALVAIMMGTASAAMPSVLVGAIKQEMVSENTNTSEVLVTALGVSMTMTLPMNKTDMAIMDRDVMVYNMYTLIANMADNVGMKAATLGVDHGNPTMGVYVVDKSGAMVMYYTVTDPLSMNPTTLSADVEANLVIT